jgi:hypothetical protein
MSSNAHTELISVGFEFSLDVLIPSIGNVSLLCVHSMYSVAPLHPSCLVVSVSLNVFHQRPLLYVFIQFFPRERLSTRRIHNN